MSNAGAAALHCEHSEIQFRLTQGLVGAAVTWVHKCQFDVLRRVGEVWGVRPDAIRKARANARADAKVTAQRVAAERERKAFVPWNNGKDGWS